MGTLLQQSHATVLCCVRPVKHAHNMSILPPMMWMSDEGGEKVVVAIPPRYDKTQGAMDPQGAATATRRTDHGGTCREGMCRV